MAGKGGLRLKSSRTCFQMVESSEDEDRDGTRLPSVAPIRAVRSSAGLSPSWSGRLVPTRQEISLGYEIYTRDLRGRPQDRGSISESCLHARPPRRSCRRETNNSGVKWC